MNNSIIKSIEINAPINRVWQALTDYQEFGSWFMVALENPFEVGQITTGRMLYPGSEGMLFTVRVLKMDAPTFFSFRWPWDEHNLLDSEAAMEQTILVEFTLSETIGGTRLEVVESGFERVPENQRASMIQGNTRGWEEQTQNIRNYVEADNG
ncbi:MAG: SRPBCC family protein [Pseudomonadota bacterium]